jgi:hypothetical protein
MTTTVAPQIMFLTLFLSVMWGIYLGFTIREYVRVKRARLLREDSTLGERRSSEVVANFRRVVVAFCMWMLPVSFLLRTTLVTLGFGADVVGTISFFTLAGANVVGSIFVVATLRWKPTAH